MDLKGLILQLTLEEKATLLSGRDYWHTVAVERLGIPGCTVADGPHGLRKETGLPGGQSLPATCFPTGSALASSWDRALLEELGAALAEECRELGVDVLLGPAANIKRSPLCGRNFEYYSEDPCLSSQLAASYIKGVQGGGVGTALKHFAANNKETDRMTTDTAVDERTLREIYLSSFEHAVKDAKPWTVMCAYNKLNGVFCSENRRLLTDILRGEWGFEGLVMSDWGAVNERDRGVAAGLDLEMPPSGGSQNIIDALTSGRLAMAAVDTCVARVITLALRAKAEREKREGSPLSSEAAAAQAEAACTGAPGLSRGLAERHHALARSIAAKCMVLLKNDGVLPLKKAGTLAVIGAFAAAPRFEGGGSSHINPTGCDIPLEEIKKAAPGLNVVYFPGYGPDGEADAALIAEAAQAASEADAAVVFAGLYDAEESEGRDRTGLGLSAGHNALIEAVAAVQRNTAVVLFNGAPVEMPWIDRVPALLEGYLSGQASGGAAADILFGDKNPSGRLAETFPERLCDTPCYLSFPGERPDYVSYREEIFVGYRYYEKKRIKPLFPFGHGLSYTRFEYRAIAADKFELREDETLKVAVTVANTGARPGVETVQLYVRDEASSVVRPEKELRGFCKAALDPGEEKTVTFELFRRDFAYYDVPQRDWRVEEGEFCLLAGPSSADTPLCAAVTVHPLFRRRLVFTRQTPLRVVFGNPAASAVAKQFFSQAGSYYMPDSALELPLRCLRMVGLSDKDLDGFIAVLNGTQQ